MGWIGRTERGAVAAVAPGGYLLCTHVDGRGELGRALVGEASVGLAALGGRKRKFGAVGGRAAQKNVGIDVK